MGTEIVTLQALAAEAYDCFESATRSDGERFDRLKEEAPDWVRDLVREAHGDMLPDDWRYSAIRVALETIADCDDPDDASFEFADGQIDVYTSARYAWLSSNLNRAGYVDDAIAEFGGGRMSDGEYGRGGGEALGVVDMIGQGQYMEAQDVYGSVLSSLNARLEEIEDEDGGETDA